MTWTSSTPPPARLTHPKLGEPARVWEIADVEGNLFGTKARFDLPDGSKAIFWARNGSWSLQGLRTADAPLYGSHDLPAADPSQPVYICEGEKAADAGREIGAVALGTVTGASGTPARKVLEVLAGRKIILCPDNDDPGREHMKRVAAILEGLGSSIFWLELPGVEAKGDLADWTTAGGTLDELLTLTENAGPPPRPQSPTDSALASLSSIPKDDVAGNLERPLRALADAMSSLDGLGRAIAREQALRVLKDLGLSAPAKLLDSALPSTESEPQIEIQSSGRPLCLEDPEPWGEPVNGARLLEDIKALLDRYLILPTGGAVAVALWVLHTWTLDYFHVSPRLAILSPVKRCGKTRLLRVLAKLTRRPYQSGNMTSSSIFRTQDMSRPTLLLDEGDNWINDSPELKATLNAGWESDGIVSRVGIGPDGDFEPRVFCVYGAVAVAAIGQLYDTLADRSIVVTMRRKRRGEQVETLRTDRMEWAEPLSRQCYQWSMDSADALRSADPDVPETITSDRARDNWRVLLAIADLAGGKWPTLARESALTLESSKPEEEEASGVLLLSDLREFFSANERAHTEDVLFYLRNLEERPWAEYGRMGKPLSVNQLASLLRPFGVRPLQLRIGSANRKGYQSSDFVEAWDRYCTSRNTETKPVNTGTSAPSDPKQRARVFRPDLGSEPNGINECFGVSVRKGQSVTATLTPDGSVRSPPTEDLQVQPWQVVDNVECPHGDGDNGAEQVVDVARLAVFGGPVVRVVDDA